MFKETRRKVKKMKIYILLIVVNIVVCCESVCVEQSTNKLHCDSLQDVKSVKIEKNWEEIIINGSIHATIKLNSFDNTPNVKKITFRNTVDSIEKNAFQNIQSLKILHFYDCNLKESLWLSNLPLKELIVFDSNVNELQPNSFDNSDLERIYIKKNSISRIRNGVFTYTNIELLFLNENQIKTIDVNAFYGMRRLKRLALNGNQLTSFEPKLLIGDTSPDLYGLWISKNKIKSISRDNFDVFPKLRILLLYMNKLETIEDGGLHGLKLLSYLDISNNNLKNLPAEIIPEDILQYMDIFLIHNNRLSNLPIELLLKFPRLSKITIGGNPWQCSCYHKISKFVVSKDIRIVCDDQYLSGQRPVCVISDVNDRECEDHEDDFVNLYKHYEIAQTQYEKLPPLCKLVCNNSRPCYAHDFTNLQYNEIE